MLKLLLIALSLVVYANVYDHAFLFDDEFLILRNGFLDSFAFLGRIFTSSSTAGAGFHDSFYRPLQTVCYLIVTQLFGRAPWAFHALNVLLHVSNVLLVDRLGRRLGLERRVAAAGAALWAVHPLHVEAVTYASATADPLHALFVLAAVNVIAGGRSKPRAWAAAALGALGCLAKESALIFPALITVVVFFKDDARRAWRTYARTLPAWGMALLYFVVRRTLLHFDDQMFTTANAYADHPFTRIFTALATVPSYVGLLVWPHDLHMDREFPVYASLTAWPVGLGLLAVIAALVVIARGARQIPPTFAAFALAWVFAAHAPHSGVLIPVNSVFLEHWMYLTSVPLFLWLATALARLPSRRVAGAVTLALVVALGQKTFRQNQVWATPISFFTRTLEFSPTSARIRHNLAIAFSDAGDDDHALEQYELMIRAGTPYAQTFHNAAFIYLKRGALDRAEPYYLKALEIDPKFYPSAKDLSVLYASRGDKARAEYYLALYRRLEPPGPGR